LGGGDEDPHVRHGCVYVTEVAAHGFMYEACDIPPGMTIDEFRVRQKVVGSSPISRLREARCLSGSFAL
jgi:hypothetical protein